MDGAGRVALRVDAELVEAALDEAARVGLVVDRELARVAEPVAVGAQHPRAGRVERHDPHRARAPADEHLDALAHLLRGLVRERDREDLARAGLSRALEEGDPVRQHAGLAGARAGEDQQRALAVDDRLALRRVEPREELLDAVAGGGVRHAVQDRRGGRRPPREACPDDASASSGPIVRAAGSYGRAGNVRRTVTIACAIAAVAWLSTGASVRRHGHRGSGGCRRRLPRYRATQRSASAAAKAVLCLVNRARAERGLRATARVAHAEPRRQRAQRARWSRSGFFSHVSPDGADVRRSARAARGYLRRSRTNARRRDAQLGRGQLATPAELVRRPHGAARRTARAILDAPLPRRRRRPRCSARPACGAAGRPRRSRSSSAAAERRRGAIMRGWRCATRSGRPARRSPPARAG